MGPSFSFIYFANVCFADRVSCVSHWLCTQYVAGSDLKLPILLSLFPKCWGDRRVSPYLVCCVLVTETWTPHVLGESAAHCAEASPSPEGFLFSLCPVWVVGGLVGTGFNLFTPQTVVHFLLSVCLSVPLASGSCLFLYVFFIVDITYT